MKPKVYIWLNCVVLLVAASLFLFRDLNDAAMLIKRSMYYILPLVVIVALGHLLKGFRLYFLFSGEKITLVEFAKQYCKTVPISVIIPFKLGEIFKVYCYGYSIRNYPMAIVYILIDRFFDTLALLSIITLATQFTNGNFTWVFYLLFLFGLLIFEIYLVLPSICMYWIKYLLQARASRSNLRILSIISAVKNICNAVSTAVKGKGIIVFSLSVISWIVEIGGLALLSNIDGNASSAVTMITNYLGAALGIGHSSSLNYFVVMTIVMLIICYAVLHFVNKRQRGHV